MRGLCFQKLSRVADGSAACPPPGRFWALRLQAGKPHSGCSEPDSFSAQQRACLIWGLKPGDTRKELYAIYKTECLESSAMPQQMFGDTQGAMNEEWCQIQWPPCFRWEPECHTMLSILLSMKPTFESIMGSRASWACGSVKPPGDRR